MFLPSDFLHHEIAFVLWSLVALIGLLRLITESWPRPPRPSRPRHQQAGFALLILGLIAASPHAPQAFDTFQELIASSPHASRVVLAQDRTIDGIAFQSGSTVMVMPNGIVDSAMLLHPHTINGLSVIGGVQFRRTTDGAGVAETRFWQGKLAAGQEIPNSWGLWCSPDQPVTMGYDIHRLGDCQLAREVVREAIRIPAGSHVQCTGRDWKIDLPDASEPATVDGITVPGGWGIRLALEPSMTLTDLYSPPATQSNIQHWVEIKGLRMTGFIDFKEQATQVAGWLWQDATVDGILHKKGELMRFQR